MNSLFIFHHGRVFARRLARRCAIAIGALLSIAGCEPAPDPEVESLQFISGWFQQAESGVREESLCHGLGLLKHPQFTCDEMLSYAARVSSADRTVGRFKAHDCFQGVCGTFYELEFTGVDKAGNEVNETAVLKQDDGQYRLYWYRSNLMLATLVDEDAEKEEKAPEQVAYDALTALFPSLYEYPPCYGARPSSTTLIGEMFVTAEANVEALHDLAQQCPDSFCFALVGHKIAPLCPN